MRSQLIVSALTICLAFGASSGTASAGSLTAGNVTMSPGTTAYVEVSGTIAGESAIYVTMDIYLSGGTSGTVKFTPAPPTDILQVGDPWPGAGTFRGDDTDVVGDNGQFTVDTNGTGTLSPVTFSGPLVRFPVIASPTARGVWVVELGGLAEWGTGEPDTTVFNGTVTVVTDSCSNNADCDDGFECTTDTCVANNCQHDAVTPGTACGSPVNNACTAPDTCNAEGVCQRNDSAHGTACTSPNVCITGESCGGGFCVGTHTPNCCNNNAECNDHNACTNDSCLGNACQHGNALTGAACGSGVDDACTDADTCDGSGNCQPNNVADLTLCGGLQCQGGQCGSPTYAASALPEGGNVGSEPRDGVMWDFDEELRTIVVGRVIDGGSVDHAAVWNCDGNGTNCALVTLPEDGASTSVANRVECMSGACLAVGSKGSPARPAAWVSTDPNSGIWVAESVPIPAGFTAGVTSGTSGGGCAVAQLYCFRASTVGEIVNAVGLRGAARWERDGSGEWTVAVLPDFGVPGRDSAANDLSLCDGSVLTLCDANELLIAGFAEDAEGMAQPVVWRENAAFSGEFTMTAVPLPEGAVSGVTTSTGSGGCARPPARCAQHPVVFFGGTVELVDGRSRGAVWKTADLSSWSVALLPPLAGLANSICGTPIYINDMIAGSSVPAGGDPLLDGVATQWTLDLETLALASGPTDVNTTISGLPSGCLFALPPSNAQNLTQDQLSIWFGPVICPLPVAGTPQPHAAIAVSLPQSIIPAVSTWGMAVMVLLVSIAGTMVIRRNRNWNCDGAIASEISAIVMPAPKGARVGSRGREPPDNGEA